MAGHRHLCKLVISMWRSVPRRIKVLFVVTVVLLVILPIIVQSRKLSYTRTMYELQKPVENVFDAILEDVIESAPKDRWKPLNIVDSMIFSAYVDDRPEVIANYWTTKEELTWAVIRIIAIMPLNYSATDLQCVYSYDRKDQAASNVRRMSATSVQAIRENWDMKYSAFFVLCDLSVPKNWFHGLSTEYLPTSVTVSQRNVDVKKESFVKIHYPIKGFRRGESSHEFLAVCVPVFHHQFNKPLHFIEFVEFYQMLGANHFTFYNSSVSTAMNGVLKYYENSGNVSILPWDLPPIYVFEETLRVHGIFAAINDCLYRSSFYKNYKYVATVDIDEFIVPRQQDNFRDLINYLELANVRSSNYASFIFRNAFFYDFYPDDDEGKNPDVPYLLTQAKTKRVVMPNVAGIRSKYIVRSRDVVELGNHQIWEFRGPTPMVSSFGPLSVDEDIALLHHYRACEAETDYCTSKLSILDRVAHKFTHELGRRVSRTCNAIFGRQRCSSFHS